MRSARVRAPTGVVRQVYFKGAAAALVVVDPNSAGGCAAALESARVWIEDVRSKVTLPRGDPVPVLLLANKSDRGPPDMTMEEVKTEALDIGFDMAYPTSAKTGENVAAWLLDVAERVMAGSGDFLDGNSERPWADAPDRGCCSA